MFYVYFSKTKNKSRHLCSQLNSSEYNHVAVGDGTLVYEPTGSHRWWLDHSYRDHYPGFQVAVAISGGQLDHLNRTESNPGGQLDHLNGWKIDGADSGFVPGEPYWRKIITRRDCVGIAVRELRKAGFRVPWFVLTPGQLFDFLRRNGAEISIG